MLIEKNLKNPIVSFIILSNLIFWPLFLLVGAAKLLRLPLIVFDILLCVSSWSSTFAFAILFKRIYKGQSFRKYVKGKFKEKLKLSVVILAVIIEVIIFIGLIFIVKAKSNEGYSIFSVTSFGMFVYLFLKNLFAGPTGEELGWRGFALNELQKKHSPLKSALIIGFWWGLWHLPIMLTSGLTGISLIKYIVCFMISIVSLSIVMTVFYNLNKNLIITITIHQLANFFIGIINANLTDIIMYYALLHFITAVIVIAVNYKRVFRQPIEKYSENYF